MWVDFRWNDWNVEHIELHGVTPEEAEEVVRGAKRPYPRDIGDDKLLVRGQTEDGRYLQVIFVWDVPDEQAYVIHARPLTRREKHGLRRRRKR